MSKFKKAIQKPYGKVVTLFEDAKSVKAGTAEYIGPLLVGVFLERKKVQSKQWGEVYVYNFHLYADPNDESKFGQAPDGEEVSMFGTAVIDSRFDHGEDGSGIPEGAIVQISFEGETRTAKGNFCQQYEVGFFMPKVAFKKTARDSDEADRNFDRNADAEPEDRPVKTPMRRSPAVQNTSREDVPAAKTPKSANPSLDELGF